MRCQLVQLCAHDCPPCSTQSDSHQFNQCCQARQLRLHRLLPGDVCLSLLLMAAGTLWYWCSPSHSVAASTEAHFFLSHAGITAFC